MIDIQAGDVVVCVDDSPCAVTGCCVLVRGRAYRVSKVWAYPHQNYAHVLLQGEKPIRVPGHKGEVAWGSYRFRKIDKATDDFTTQIKAIRPIKQREDA